MPWKASVFAGLLLLLPPSGVSAQQTTVPQEQSARPLPDVATLMQQVESNQRRFEALARNYTYRESEELQEFDSHEGLKKTRRREADVFWIDGVPIERTVSLDGQPLSAEEQKKESERVDKQAAKARERRDKADAEGKETDPRGHDLVTASRILELGSFSNPRREVVAGRDTIVVDYAGNPKAKTHNAAESVFQELAGTVWVDEEDKVVQHAEGHFANDFKIAGGLVASVKKGTSFEGTFVKINNEVWLPQGFHARGQMRYLLFFSLNGEGRVAISDYRKFRATSTLLPSYSKVDPESPEPEPSAPAPPPQPGPPGVGFGSGTGRSRL